MKLPKRIRQDVADQGAVVLAGRGQRDEAVSILVRRTLDREPVFVRDVLALVLGRVLDRWLVRHAAPAAEGAQLGLFPDLPRLLEVAPGRFVDQAAMTRRDWDAARVQARTKAANAAGFADAVERAWEQVAPLLTDDALTTGEVLTAVRSMAAAAAT